MANEWKLERFTQERSFYDAMKTRFASAKTEATNHGTDADEVAGASSKIGLAENDISARKVLDNAAAARDSNTSGSLWHTPNTRAAADTTNDGNDV
jgi:hypothetical protein